MNDHGRAQRELIRRYARTLRELQADAKTTRAAPDVDRAGRIVRAARPPAAASEGAPPAPPAA